MSKRIRYNILGQGRDCPKCKNPMQRRIHKSIDARILRQPFYFIEWDYCTSCNHLQHYEEMKRYNDNDMAEYSKFKDAQEEQLSFLSSV